MVKAQEWLDGKYPMKEKRKELENLDLRNLDLEGDLDLGDFTYSLVWDIGGIGTEIYITGNPRLGAIKNKSEYATIYIEASVANAQDWLNGKYPKPEKVNEINQKSKWKGGEEIKETISGELNIINFPQLEKVDVSCGVIFDVDKEKIDNRSKLTELDWTELSCQKKLTKLQISDCPQLTELDCKNNRISELVINNCPNLQSINASMNQLTNLDLSNNQQLEELSIGYNNFLPQDLSFLSHLVSLKKIWLSRNHFTGSLEPLRNLIKLEELSISDTDISYGLEYLPKSVKKIDCSFNERPESRVSDIWEELQPFGFGEYGNSDLKKWRTVKIDKKLTLLTSPLLPPQLLGELKQKNKFAELVKKVQRQNRENKLLTNISKIDYEKIHFNNWPRNNKDEISSSEQLPTRLYNIQENKVEETKDNHNIKNYAILSYVWGNPNMKATEEMENYPWWKRQLTVSGNKSLRKAIKTCGIKELDVNYIWIDQLCIKQENSDEAKRDKEREISKMRQYYTNATITLIAMNDELGDTSDIDLMEILGKIVESEWFTRSWTYQEGWLSKHTIFMFDDKLVDGWAIAGTWTLNQLGYANEGRYNSRSEFNKGSKKIATPVGWVYYRDGYTNEDKVEISLNQALKEVKKRGRSVPIDGIYSILGLLPYGEHVEIKYNQNNKYTQEELNQVLYNVMKVAMGYRKKIEPADYTIPKHSSETLKKTLSDRRLVIEYKEDNGYGEPMAWHGSSNTTPELCWMPQIDETGSTSVEGGIDVNFPNDFTVNPFKEGKGFQLFSTNYIICKVKPDIQKLEGGFEIEGGLYEKEVEVKIELKDYESDDSDFENEKDFKKYKEEIENSESIQISLLGTQATLELVKEGNVLLVPEETWISKKSFALLSEKTEISYRTYHRLGLVELGNGERLERGSGDCITIGTINSPTEQYEAQIEVPSKH